MPRKSPKAPTRAAQPTPATTPAAATSVEQASVEETDSRDDRDLFPIVGIGASAGGLQAVTQLFKALPVDTGMALVVVQPLARPTTVPWPRSCPARRGCR